MKKKAFIRKVALLGAFVFAQILIQKLTLAQPVTNEPAAPENQLSVTPTAVATPTASSTNAFTPAAIAQVQGNSLFTINRENASQYKTIIIPELYPFLRAGELELNVAKNLGYEWRYDDEWIRNSLQADGAFVSTKEMPGVELLQRRGFIAGVANSIARETDSGIVAERVLWNIMSTIWSERIVDLDFELSWIKQRKLEGSMHWNLERAYVKQLLPEDKTAQVFREIARITRPEAVAQLSFLTFRFAGEEEDAFWIYSPAIKKVRPLSGSTRSDSLAASSLSLDDLMLWSGKMEMVEAKFDRSFQALVPFAAMEMATLQGSGSVSDCFDVKETDSALSLNRASRWPFENTQQPLANFVLPAGSVFVPRELWRLELISKDPYSQYGRQVLYVDPILMLPVYKIVYDHSGSLWKVALSAYGLASDSENGVRVPYPSFTLVVDVINGVNSVLDYSRVSYCAALNEKVSLSKFDPYQLGSEVAGAPGEGTR